MRIYPSTNMTQFVYYVLDSTNGWLKKIPVTDSNAVITVATGITNTTPFSLEDFKGTVLTNNQNRAVMSVLLQMRRESAVSKSADYFQIRAKVTRRNIL